MTYNTFSVERKIAQSFYGLFSSVKKISGIFNIFWTHQVGQGQDITWYIFVTWWDYRLFLTFKISPYFLERPLGEGIGTRWNWTINYQYKNVDEHNQYEYEVPSMSYSRQRVNNVTSLLTPILFQLKLFLVSEDVGIRGIVGRDKQPWQPAEITDD